MVLQMTQGENYASVILGNDVSWGGCCMSVTFEGYAEKTCSCGSVEYALFRKNAYPNGDMLLGHGEVNGVGLLVRMHGGDADEIQPIFENILENFGIC